MERIRRKLEALEEADVPRLNMTAQALASHGLTGITLRPYQLTGVHWLVERYHRNHGCILGDEMGLGKTCQTISLLMYLYGSGDSTGPFLILSPLSVMGNWKDELQRFTPGLEVVSYMGDKERREELRQSVTDSDTWNVVLTTYEICLKDATFLQQFSWAVLVVDEAKRLKNQNSLLHQTLKEFDIKHRVLLTGTPVQNNLQELYALLSFIAPRVFRPSISDDFVEEYDDISSDKVKNDLHSILLPFLLRRTKSEVVLDLPKKSEVLLYHGLSALQKKLYKAVLTKDIEAFEQAGSSTSYGPSKTRLMNVLMQLRKVVNHPYLFDGVEPEPFELGEHLVEASGKLHLLDQLLTFLYQNGHKVLLFSQMTHMLDILQDYLGFRGYSYERLDGSVRGEERFLAIKNFNDQDETFVFLLSTKAGGQGLNLTAADTVIFVDSDFNPQNDIQAAARAHRIGQSRPVKIIRLVGRDSVEELILRKADAKLKLTNSVIEGGQFSLGGAAALAESATQLSDMIKFGLDKLLQSAESSVVDVDLKPILGGSLKGEWVLEENPTEKDEEEEEEMEEEDEDDAEKKVTHMYMFEGKDYSKEPSAEDTKAFDELVAAEMAAKEATVVGPRSLRKHRDPVVFPELQMPTRKRKELTDEEKEERKKKRQEAAAKRAKLQEEAEVKRAQERRQRLEKLWERNSYESANIAMDTDDEDEDEERDVLGFGSDDDDEGSTSRAMKYVRGDVTHPQNAGEKDAIVVHCVDDSGAWGQGGIFSALARRSDAPEIQYEIAGKMKDLALGDAHVVPIDDKESRDKGSDKVALIVAQHRDRHNNLSGIKLTALNQGLQRVYKAAKADTASVHLPRIGYATPGFNWYGTERLIRKHLAAKGIPTYVYYYPRKHSRQQAAASSTSPAPEPTNTNSNNASDISPSTNVSRERRRRGLPGFLQGVTVVFQGVTGEELEQLQRFVIAYPFC
ncbi:chromodomain-helicase-DNA-binding protein 1-like [Amphiura filiformis]|uniref:chromodomain-helicase-DNA-binding protein 1-like n=1 Tax=Amphiura filiformis TaxID=82378 RepID=UPI003B20C2A0